MTGQIVRILVLVDATNVARSAAWRNRCPQVAEDERFDKLVDAVNSWAAVRGTECVLIFDGSAVVQTPSARSGCEIVNSGERTADDLVEQRASNARMAQRPHWIVSGDRELRLAAGGGADRVLDPDAFVAMLSAAPAARGTPPAERAQPASRVGDIVPAEVRARLERMRRGKQ